MRCESCFFDDGPFRATGQKQILYCVVPANKQGRGIRLCSLATRE